MSKTTHELDTSLVDIRAAIIHDRNIANREGFKGCAQRAQERLDWIMEIANNTSQSITNFKIVIETEATNR